MNFALRLSRSPLTLGIIWIFVAAYFFDAANLDDLLPGNVVLHEDTDESTVAPPRVAFEGLVNSPAKSISPRGVPVEYNRPHFPRVVIDQDSPSLAAEHLVAITSSTVLVEERGLPLQSYRSAPSLYLLNCSLLM